MSAAGSSGFACERIVPGHHPALEQVANAPRYPHRLVEELRLEGEHTLRLVLDDSVTRPEPIGHQETAPGFKRGCSKHIR